MQEFEAAFLEPVSLFKAEILQFSVLALSNQIKFVLIKSAVFNPSQSVAGLSLRSNSNKQKAIEPSVISLSNTERPAIMKDCGKLNKTGFSVSTDCP